MPSSVSQKPSSPALELGLGSDTISIMIRETKNLDDSTEVEYVPNEDGEDSVALISNPGRRFTVDGFLLSGQTVPRKGDVVTAGGVGYIVEASQVRRTSKAARISLTLYKPDNTTWAATGNGSST